MNEKDLAFMNVASQEADLSFQAGEVPVGAVIVKDGEIIARARNTREQDLDISGHAEINAIKAAEKALGRWTLEGCTLYVTLEPCPMCAGAIKQSRLSSIVFGASDEAEGAVCSAYHLFDKDNGAQSVSKGVMEKECREILQRFFKTRRETSK